MVLKGVNLVLLYIKLVQIVLKGVNRVHNDKIGSNGRERSQLGTQCKNQVIWSWKESIGYTMMKLMWNGLERSQLGKQYIK